METNREIKQDLIQKLYDRPDFIKQVDSIEYRTRCPFCGDSVNERTGHLYMRINPDDNFPIVYHCFKCEEKGVLKPETLMLLGIDDVNLKSSLYSLNKTSNKLDGKKLITETKNMTFDYYIPNIKIGKKTKYIEDRLGLKFDLDHFKEMKVITSLFNFLKMNNIQRVPFDNYQMGKLEDHYVGFLTYGNSHILFRDITEKEKLSWIKYPISKDSKYNRVFYVMSTEIDVFSSDNITINLAEGVIDTLSACYNLNHPNSKNCMNISVSGKYYDKLLMYLLDMGLVGENITINIYADNDYSFNRKGNNYRSTNLEYYQKTLKMYKYLYKEINVYYNLKEKDIGRPIQDIALKKHKL